MDKLKVWIARDEDGELFVYENDPIKDGNCWQWGGDCFKSHIDFPSVRWEDDKPTEAYITLTDESANKQSVESTKPTKEIDWEQRRYEIAKDLLVKKYLEVGSFSLKRESDIRLVIGYANNIINELKKQNK